MDPREAFIRQAEAQAKAQAEFMRMHQAQAELHRMYNANYRAEPSRQRSRFDGPDVIDLVRAADGSYHVPTALEAKVRQP